MLSASDVAPRSRSKKVPGPVDRDLFHSSFVGSFASDDKTRSIEVHYALLIYEDEAAQQKAEHGPPLMALIERHVAFSGNLRARGIQTGGAGLQAATTSTTMNSSPPLRETIAVFRVLARRVAATATSARSPSSSPS